MRVKPVSLAYFFGISKGHLAISKGHLSISKGHLAISKGHLVYQRVTYPIGIYRTRPCQLRVSEGTFWGEITSHLSDRIYSLTLGKRTRVEQKDNLFRFDTRFNPKSLFRGFGWESNTKQSSLKRTTSHGEGHKKCKGRNKEV